MKDLENKVFYIMGVANKKSVAYFIAKALIENGAKVILSGQTKDHCDKIQKLLPESFNFVCDVEKQEDLINLKDNISQYTDKLDGLVHSIAFANFDPGQKDFLDTSLANFQQAIQISCLSLTQVCNELRDIFNLNSSIVTISISNTKATSYGYMGPIKAMLENSVCYIAKAFSEFSNIRVNSIGAGPLKTSASAGIPNYIENYLYAEKLTLRKKNLGTSEVANTALFLLSDLSSGINAQNIVVDAGMSVNYFDQEIVKNL